MWASRKFANATTLGDVLADFADVGFTVVIASYALNLIPIDGRIVDYLPLTNRGSLQFGPNSLVAVNASHPLLNGVSSFQGRQLHDARRNNC